MALPAPTQFVSGSAVSANPSCTPASTASGALLVAFVGNLGSGGGPVSPTGITDNKSNAWTSINTSITFGGIKYICGTLYYCESAIGGVTSVTANGLTSSQGATILFMEFPLSGTGNLDVHNIQSGSASTQPNTATSPSVTTTATNELQIGYVVYGTPSTITITGESPSTNYHGVDYNPSGFDLFCAVTAASTTSIGGYTSSFTTSSTSISWLVGIATFKVPSVANNNQRLPMMGIG